MTQRQPTPQRKTTTVTATCDEARGDLGIVVMKVDHKSAVVIVTAVVIVNVVISQ